MHLVVGTAGHIDHGKSTLVHALTGIDPDRLKEEKARGITIELGFAHAAIDDVTVAFVDVPGHERFVKTMLAGAGGVDAVMLIVAADESVMPQTREHFDICRLLHVQHGVVAITKTDLVDADTLDLVRLEVRELVDGSFLASAPVVPVSAQTGAGVDDLRRVLAALARHIRPRTADGATRLPIDRAFTMQGFGTVVTGTLVAGAIDLESELDLVPDGPRVRVRGVQVHGKKRSRAVAGQRTAVNLGGIEVAEITRGQSLVSRNAVTVTRRLDATVDLLTGAKPLKHGARVRFHQGTSELLGRVSLVGSATELTPGTRASARIRLEQPAAVTRGDRFILRAYSPPQTIGGGQILDPAPGRSTIRTLAAEQRFAALAGDSVAAVTQMLIEAGGHGLPTSALIGRAGLSPADAAALAADLHSQRRASAIGELLVATPVLRSLATALLAVVENFHKVSPLAEGLPREEARARVFAHSHDAVFDAVVKELTADGRLVGRDRLALAGHSLDLSSEEARVRERIESFFRSAGLRPPDATTLVAEAKTTPAVVEKMTTLLLRQKRLARVGTLLFHVEALENLKAEIQTLKLTAANARATVDVAMFKERYGVTRKFAIPLLEWLDRERVTRRMGETRVVL